MEAVGQEKGLVRFVSENGIKNRTPFQWTRRVKAYTFLLTGLVVTLGILLITRKDVETILIRQRGSTYQITEDNLVSNIYEVNLINKTHSKKRITFAIKQKDAIVEQVGDEIVILGGKQAKERLLVKMPNNDLELGKKKIEIEVYANGELIETVKTKFIGPML
jgi:hypothetical protein